MMKSAKLRQDKSSQDKPRQSVYRADVETRIASPEDHFKTPFDVAKDPQLSDRQKAKALDNWELNERLIQVAADEGMTGGTPNKLTEVGQAKLKLGVTSLSKNAK